MPKGVYIKSPEHREKLRQILSKASIGRVPWNKGLKGTHFSRKTEFGFGNIPWNKGKTYLAGELHPMFGKRHSEESLLKISKSRRGQCIGEKNPNWKGGKTKESKLIRSLAIYRDWRKQVFERDDYTCQFCKQHGGELNADHIKPFALYPELRFDINNGRTLCRDCHKTTETFGNRLVNHD